MAKQGKLNKRGSSFKWMRESDIAIAAGVVIIIGMLIIPIPAFVLDFTIAINLSLSLTLLLIVMYLKRGAELSVFPSLLLITTVFRLAINVSSTRLILLEGRNFEGEIIKAFGDFVVQNNYIVGMIIFLILIAVQFIVIIKGATRVSEVAARFTLDALPGKQMSIDADLNAGLISESEALRRRKEVREEVDFYGAMDGASKFVQGDVRVGLLITIINIVGGLIVGTTLQGMSLSESFDVFFILTVGDGLSAQIPSLLISTATGIIVTRSVSERSLGDDIGRQLTLKPKALMVTGGFVLLLAVLPGFPKAPLIVIGLLLLLLGIFIYRNMDAEEREEGGGPGAADGEDETLRQPESVVNLINVEPIEVEIGFNLVPLVDIEQGGDILERVKLIRKSCALDLGLVVPPIRIRDNMKLKPSDYNIKIKGVPVGKGSLSVKRLLAIPSYKTKEGISGDETIEPAFKTKAYWIDEQTREEAENLHYSVVDPPSIIATHLTELIKQNSSDILGRQEVKQLLDSVKEDYPAVVEESLKASNIGVIQKVLQNLLKEQVSVRNMVSILEVIADYGEKVTNLDALTEYVRGKLSKQISHQYISEDNVIRGYTVDAGLDDMLEKSLQETEHGYVSTLDIGIINRIITQLISYYEDTTKAGYQMILLSSSTTRMLLKKLTERSLPNLVVLSYNEIIADVKFEQLGILKLEEIASQK